MVHSDGKTAAKAVELFQHHRREPFWWGVGFVGPQVPFIAPRSYFLPFKPHETIASLCGLDVPTHLQGKDISGLLDDPTFSVRDAAFSGVPSSNDFLIRENRWAYLQYGEHAERGQELFDMDADPQQFTNLATSSEHAETVKRLHAKLAVKLAEVRENDL